MVIRHSLKILEQLSEIEKLISKIERYMDETGIEVDREELLKRIVRTREAKRTSRGREKN